MVRHIVMWRLHDVAEGEDRATNARRAKTALEALAGRIPGLLRIEVGIQHAPPLDGFDLVLSSDFESIDALSAYQGHPEHQKVGAFIARIRRD